MQNTITTTYIKLVIIGLLLFCVVTVHAATLSLTPGTGVYTAGSTFTARVVVNTSGDPINAADGTLSFNPKEITVVGVSKGNIFTLWTAEPSYSNANGTITFSGGSPTGYTGSNGTVISVTFKVNSAGSPRVNFSDGSVLAADGKGTNVLTAMNGGAYTISAADVVPEPETIEYIAPANTPSAPIIESSTHPDSTAWYTQKTASLRWKLPEGVTAVRTLLDEHSGSIPTKVYDTPINEITIDDLEEGVSYFHIQFKNAEGWGKVAHYRLAVDTQKPTAFEIALPEQADLSNPIQTLLLKTEDATSKVKRFLVQLDGKDPYEFIDETGSSTLTLPSLEPGHHTAIIEAFDEAGNSIISTFSFSILAFDKPQFTEYPSEINEQVIPVIKGITRPNAKVRVTLAPVGAAAKYYEVMSGANGEFVFIVDTQKPTAFEIALPEQADLSNPIQTLLLKTEDATSKVKRFLVQLDGKDPYEFIDETGSSTLTLPSLEPGHHTAIIEAFDEAGNSIISTFSFSILAFDKPQFTEYPSEINEQVIPVIKGITRPNAKVRVTLAPVGAAAKYYEVMSGANGEFVFIPEARLPLGVYELTAVAIDQYGAQSDVSDTIRIAVQQPGFIQLGGLLVSVLSVIVPLAALCALLFLLGTYLLARMRSLKRGVSREAQEATAMLASEFSKLQKELAAQKAQLEGARKTKKLTKAESTLFETLAQALQASQKRVEKEIGDVEDLVD